MMKTLLISIFVALGLLNGSVLSVHADSTETEAVDVEVPIIYQPDFLPGPEQGTDGDDVQNYVLNEGFSKAMNIGIGILGLAAFLGILIAAIQMLTAYGDENKLSRGKTNIKYSILGFVFVMFAYAIVSIAVSVVLPSNGNDQSYHWSKLLAASIPTAKAVDVENDINILFPSPEDLVQGEQENVNLPSGDFLYEIVPAIITNIMYAVGFLIFIALIYGGSIIVYGRGNEEEVTKAKTIVTYASIALGLISLGYALIYGIATLNLQQNNSSTGDDLFTEDEL